MNHSAIKRVLSLTLAILLLSISICGAVSCARGEAGKRETEITSVLLNKSGEKVTVKATLSEDDAAQYKSAMLCLFALEPFETVEALENGRLKPIAESHGSERMTFSVAFSLDGGMRDRLTQRFYLAKRDENGVYKALTEGKYISNPEVLASGAGSASPSALKGLALSINEDVSTMTPAHAVLDLAIERYLYASPVKGDTVTHSYAGSTLSLSRDAIDALDEQIAALTAQGCAIYFRPILTASPDTLEALSCIGYVGAPDSRAYALNFEDPQGAFYLSAFFSFLASRYPNTAGVIPGYALNDPLYAGTTAADVDAHVKGTLTLMRVVYNTFRAWNSSVQVYLPVNNLYTTDGATGKTGCGSREFLGAFSAHARAVGDFDWSVYLTMDIPTDRSETIYTESGTVNREGATEKYILPQTFPLLLEQLSSEQLLYGGAARGVMWGLAVPGTEDSENQRLSLLYTYMKALLHNKDRAANAPVIRAVIWETLNDEGDRLTGLVAANGKEKPVGRLFDALGRSDLSSVISTATAQSRLGTRYDEISEMLKSCGESVTYFEGEATGSGKMPEHAVSTVLYGENDAWSSEFRVLPGTGVVSSYRQSYDTMPMLLATFKGAVGCGVYTESLYGADLKDRQMLSLMLTAKLPEGMTNAPVTVMLSAEQDGRTYRYEGTGTVTDGTWTTLSCGLKEFAEKIGDGTAVTLTISLVGVEASEASPVSLYISRIELFETRGWFVRGGWILILVIVIVLLLVAAVIWLFRTYDIRWVPSHEKEKTPKNTGRGKMNAFFESVAAMLARLRPSKKAHTRIMVKPDTADPSNRPGEGRAKELDAEEDFSIEEAEELFHGETDDYAGAASAEIVTDVFEVEGDPRKGSGR